MQHILTESSSISDFTMDFLYKIHIKRSITEDLSTCLQDPSNAESHGFKMFPTPETSISISLQYSQPVPCPETCPLRLPYLCIFQYSNSHLLTSIAHQSNSSIFPIISTNVLLHLMVTSRISISSFSFNPYTPSGSNFFHSQGRVHHLLHQKY